MTSSKPLTFLNTIDLGGAEGVEAVDEGDADLDFGGLAVGVSCRDAFAKGLQAPHFCLDPASDVISGPSLPERPAIVPGGAQGLVSSDCRRAVLFPRPPILADRDDRGGLTVDNGGVAAAGVIGTVRRHSADLLTFRDLVEQLRQDRAVTITAGGEFHGADI